MGRCAREWVIRWVGENLQDGENIDEEREDVAVWICD